MKIQIKSDVHEEFWDHRTRLVSRDPPVKNEIVLIVAGDIHSDIESLKYYLIKQSKIYKHVLFVTGNHDYYGKSINETDRELIKLSDAEQNITFLSQYNPNSVFKKDNYVFIGDILWSDFERQNPMSMIACQKGINDYYQIEDTTPQLTYDEHQKSKDYLIRMLEKYKDKEVVVVTHMAPSWQSVSDEFKTSSLNGGFASNLEDIILKYQPKIWIHGHTHQAFHYEIDKTHVICNPVGYPYEQNNGYQNEVIDLEEA